MLRISLDSSWRFLLNPERNMKYRSIPGDRVVDLPHDFSMELPAGLMHWAETIWIFPGRHRPV